MYRNLDKMIDAAERLVKIEIGMTVRKVKSLVIDGGRATLVAMASVCVEEPKGEDRRTKPALR